MTNPAASSHHPLSRAPADPWLDRLDWEDIHRHVQSILQQADANVRAAVSGLRVTSGSTRSQHAFSLFSYRTYEAPDKSIDPVVVGVSFQRVPQGIRISGDIAGESRGDIPFASAAGAIARQIGDVYSSATSVSQDLARQTATIIAALQDSTRRPSE